MTSGIKRAALAYNTLSKIDRKWLLQSLDNDQKRQLLEAVNALSHEVENSGKLTFSELFSMFEGSEEVNLESSSGQEFNKLPFTSQVNIVDSMSVESIWAFSYWDKWLNKEAVLSSLSNEKRESLKSFYKHAQGVPNEFFLDGVVDYVMNRAEVC